MRDTPEGVPFESLSLRVPNLAAVAMLLASVAAVPAVFKVVSWPHLGRVADEILLTLLATTALLTAVVARRAPRAQTVKRAIAYCLLVAPLLGALNVGLCAAILHATGGDLLQSLVLLFVGSLFGLVIGAPAGLAFGISFLVPAICSVRGSEVASHATVERSLTIIGIWLATMSLVVMAYLRLDPWSLSLPAALGFVVGGLAATIGIALTVRRRLWLARVRSGQVRGWSVEARVERPDEDALRPFIHQPRQACWDVLVRRADVASPYRDRADAEPVALL